MKRRSLSMLLSLALLLCLAACRVETSQKPIQGEPSAPADGQQASEQPTDAGKETEPEAVTIEEDTVLLDQNQLVITAKELVDDAIWGMGVKVLIENNSDKNVGVRCNSLIVNNYMITDLFSASVAAGKKANETIYLSSSSLEAAGIDTIADIVFSFHVYDGDSYSGLFDTEEIELKTSAYGTVDQPAMDDGKELLNQDGIRIIGRYVEEGSFWGTGVLLFIENNSGKNILVQCDDMSINGFMVTPFFSCTVNQGRMALEDIMILSSDLESNDIETVEDIELAFKIADPDTYRTILESGPVAFSAQ